MPFTTGAAFQNEKNLAASHRIASHRIPATTDSFLELVRKKKKRFVKWRDWYVVLTAYFVFS
jgi:hypothetical protein